MADRGSFLPELVPVDGPAAVHVDGGEDSAELAIGDVRLGDVQLGPCGLRELLCVQLT